MSQFWFILQLVLPVFFLVGLGVALRKFNILTSEADKSILTVVVNVLYPCLLFESVLSNETLRLPGMVWMAPAAGFLTVLGGYFLAFILGKWMGIGQPAALRAFSFSNAVCNYGYIGIPVTLALFGREILGVFLLFNMGSDIAFWMLAGTVAPQVSFQDWKKILNPGVLAIWAGIAVNLSGLASRIPEFLNQTLFMAGNISIPLGLLLIGAMGLDLVLQNKNALKISLMIRSSLARLLLFPLLLLWLAHFAWMPKALKIALMVHASLPAALLPILMVKHYKGHVETALSTSLSTSLLGLMTIPLWLKIGMQFLKISAG